MCRSTLDAIPAILAMIITGLAFGFIHPTQADTSGLGLKAVDALTFDGGFQFDAARTLSIALTGILWAWLRLYTGSLLLPVIPHNAGNNLSIVMAFLI